MLMSFINKLIAVNAECTKVFTAVIAALILTSCIYDSKPCGIEYPDNVPAYLTVSLNIGDVSNRVPGRTKTSLTEADMESGIESESSHRESPEMERSRSVMRRGQILQTMETAS